MFSIRRPSWFTLFRRGSSEPAMHDVTDRRHPAAVLLVAYRWPHPKARPAVKWLDRSMYLPWLVGK